MTFITQMLNSNLNHVQHNGQPISQYKVLDKRLQRSVSHSEMAERTSGCPPARRANILGADKSLARPTSRCILFDGENISFDASLVIYINSTNIAPIMVINRTYEHQNLLSL